jgi:HEAT repeat protein
MLECFFLLASGWLTPVVSSAANEAQIAADLAVLKNASISADSEFLLDFFRKRTLSDSDRELARKLIRQLGSETYRLREQAMAELVSRGPAVLEPLREALKDRDLEIVRRAAKCLARIQERDVPLEALPTVLAAAIRLLAVGKPPGAVEVMLAYAPFADNDAALDEARNLLTRMAREKDRTHPTLVAALKDPLPARRAAAGEALCRAGAPDQKQAVRHLLTDPDAYVRLRVAMALARGREADAVPVIIDTLPHLSQVHGWQAEDLLLRLAEGHTPPAVSLGTDAAARSKCRDAWQAWWREHAAKVDLAKLQEKPRLGYTLVVLLDVGRIVELGRDNQVRWQVSNLLYPLDAQLLPGDRLLVAEYYARRVSERDLKGQILWEKEVPGPLVAQRLPSGNTFIATDTHLFEIDRDGKQIFGFDTPQGVRVMKAMKLPSGEIACLTDGQRVVRFDTTGKEVHSYPVALGQLLFGGRIYMLPNLRVLIPHCAEDKVVEYDADGKAVWEVAVDKPVAAVRLPNGNTLVTTMLPQRGAVEFDRNGQEVWSYRTTTRVTRALKR